MLTVETVGMCNMCFKEKSCEKHKAGVVGCDQFAKKVKTNADRIRAMTDEELAKWMAINTDCYYCKARKDGRCDNLTATPCDSVWLDWLKQEVQDD